MRRLLPVLLLTLGACDQVFGLDGRVPPPDGPPVLVSGNFQRRWITNDAMGDPVRNDGPYPAGALSLAVSFGDASRITVPVALDGTFSFARPDAETPYRLQIAVEGRRTEIQHTAPMLELRNNFAGRPNDQRVAVTRQTLVVFPPRPTVPQVASTGLWTTTTAKYNGVNHYVDWQEVTFVSGRRGLLQQAHHDRLYFFDFIQRPSGHTTIRSYLELPDVELVDGGQAFYGDAFTTAGTTACAHLTGKRMQEVDRLTAARPMFTNPETDWAITAVPDTSVGGVGGIDIAFHRGTIGIEIDTTVAFENPIRGSSLLATMGVTSTRLVAYPGATAVPLVSTLRSYRPVTGASPCADTADLTTAVGIPGDATLDGVLLASSDDAVITPGLRETLQLTFPLASPGPVDRYAVSLYELFEDPDSGLTGSRSLREIITIEPAAIIDAAVLVPGSYYIFVITATLGFAGARDGDLATIAYPADQVLTHTGAFFVQ